MSVIREKVGEGRRGGGRRWERGGGGRGEEVERGGGEGKEVGEGRGGGGEGEEGKRVGGGRQYLVALTPGFSPLQNKVT